jgi:hypothetical protein
MKNEHEYHLINRIETGNTCLRQDLFSVSKEESGDW